MDCLRGLKRPSQQYIIFQYWTLTRLSHVHYLLGCAHHLKSYDHGILSGALENIWGLLEDNVLANRLVSIALFISKRS